MYLKLHDLFQIPDS